MEDDLFQLRQLPVVKFRRTGESSRSDEDVISGEHEIQIEGVRTELEPVELEDGAAVPKEFANPTDDTFMVEDAVEAIGFGKFQWKLSVVTGLAWMADAMEMMILSILAPQLHCEWRLPSWQVALLTSVVFVGMMSSSTLWGNISDQYGRKTGLKISVLWTLYYGILSGFAPVYSWILVLRGLVGFGIGGVPQSVTLYAEFLPMKARAKCILLIEVFWAIGTVFEVLLAVLVMPTLGWRWLLILSALPLLLFAVLCFWLPESARYDVLSGNQEKAIATLKRIATENGAPMPLGKLVISRQEDRGKMRDLFTPHFRWTTLLLWFIWFSNAFSYYGLVLLTTEFFQAGDVCSISSRREEVKAKCSLTCEYLTEEDYTDLLWTTLSEFPGVLVTLWIIDRIGRKKTMALSFFVFSFCSLLLFLCVGRNVLTVLLFIARAFISGGFQAAYVYTPEVYPTATRALGLGTCSGMARVGALITPFIAQVMLESSVYLTLVVYSGCCLLAAVASCFLPIETKGRWFESARSGICCRDGTLCKKCKSSQFGAAFDFSPIAGIIEHSVCGLVKTASAVLVSLCVWRCTLWFSAWVQFIFRIPDWNTQPNVSKMDLMLVARLWEAIHFYGVCAQSSHVNVGRTVDPLMTVLVNIFFLLLVEALVSVPVRT